MWTCQKCGECHDDTFDSCWKCAAEVLPNGSTTDPESDSTWWLGAVVAPVAFAVVGILSGLAAPRHEDDWLGLGFIPIAAFVFSAGCVLSVVCREISRRKREKLRVLANLGAWPSIVWLAFLAVLLLGRLLYFR